MSMLDDGQIEEFLSSHDGWLREGSIVVPVLITDEGDVVVERRSLVRAGLVSAAVLGVMWLPPLIDVFMHAPSNIREAASWFRHGSDQSRTFAEGWRVITGQFGGAPEWLVDKKPAEVGGESPFINVAPLPWALPFLVAGGVYLWRQGGAGRRLAALVGVTLLVSFTAVVRTVGPAFDYRLRWTWVVAMVTTVIGRLTHQTISSLEDQVGGSTYTIDVWPGHPLMGEVFSTLKQIRSMLGDLRQRVVQYNEHHERPEEYRRVVIYAGQNLVSEGSE